MKKFLLFCIVFYNFSAFSQKQVIIDSINYCHIINEDLKKTIDQFFLYEDSVWGYYQYDKTFILSIETIRSYDYNDSLIEKNFLLYLTSGCNKKTFKYYYSLNEENPTTYYVTYYNNRKIVFLLDNDAIHFIDCFLKLENKIAIKMYPITMNKYHRRNAIQRRSYIKFFYNENCELSSNIVWRNYKNVPLELRKY